MRSLTPLLLLGLSLASLAQDEAPADAPRVRFRLHARDVRGRAAHQEQRHRTIEWLLWAIVLTLLAAAVSAVFLLPMEMRGSVLGG